MSQFGDYRIPRIRKTEDWEPVFEEMFRRINLIGVMLEKRLEEDDGDDDGEEEKDWMTKLTEHPVYGPRVIEILINVGERLGDKERINHVMDKIFGGKNIAGKVAEGE